MGTTNITATAKPQNAPPETKTQAQPAQKFEVTPSASTDKGTSASTDKSTSASTDKSTSASTDKSTSASTDKSTSASTDKGTNQKQDQSRYLSSYLDKGGSPKLKKEFQALDDAANKALKVQKDPKSTPKDLSDATSVLNNARASNGTLFLLDPSLLGKTPAEWTKDPYSFLKDPTNWFRQRNGLPPLAPPNAPLLPTLPNYPPLESQAERFFF